MSLRWRLRTMVCCGILQCGALLGIPMRPEHVQDLMRSLNEPKLARTTPDEDHQGDGPDETQDSGPRTQDSGL